MFGDLMGNMQEKQEALQKKLAGIELEESIEGGAIVVKANAIREILNISIDRTKIDLNDKDQLEDMLVIAINRILEKAAVREASESKKLMSDLLPPGFGNLFG